MRLRSMLPFFVVAALISGATSASAQQFTLNATLTGAGETPAPGINTGAFGSAVVVVDMAARTVTYTVTVYNLPSGVVASHIHVGAIGTPGPVVVGFTVPTNVSNDFSFNGVVQDTAFALAPTLGIRSPDDMFQAILGNNSYVNVHSAANPGGEIRGQLILSTR
jgi:CHRD domain-containing protein